MGRKYKVVSHVSVDDLMTENDIKKVKKGIRSLTGTQALNIARSALCGTAVAYEVCIGNLGKTIVENFSNWNEMGSTIASRVGNFFSSGLSTMMIGVGNNSHNIFYGLNDLVSSKSLLFALSFGVCTYSVIKLAKANKKKKKLNSRKKELDKKGKGAPTPEETRTSSDTPTVEEARTSTATPPPATPTTIMDPHHGENILRVAQLEAENFNLQARVNNSIPIADHETQKVLYGKDEYTRGKKDGEIEERAKLARKTITVVEHNRQMNELKNNNQAAIDTARSEERTKAVDSILSQINGGSITDPRLLAVINGIRGVAYTAGLEARTDAMPPELPATLDEGSHR